MPDDTQAPDAYGRRRMIAIERSPTLAAGIPPAIAFGHRQPTGAGL